MMAAGDYIADISTSISHNIDLDSAEQSRFLGRATEARVPAAAQPAIRGVADGLPFRVDQLRALGNGVVPQQAEAALRELARRIV